MSMPVTENRTVSPMVIDISAANSGSQ